MSIAAVVRSIHVGVRRVLAQAAPVDTNVLVDRVDPRFPDKRKVATEILRKSFRRIS